MYSNFNKKIMYSNFNKKIMYSNFDKKKHQDETFLCFDQRIMMKTKYS